MMLDIPTLMVMGSFVAACSGSVLIGSWWLNQQPPALLHWGGGSLVAAAGILSLAFGAVWHDPLLLVLGNILMPLAAGLQWQGARLYDRKSTPLTVVLGGAVLVILAAAIPSARGALAGLGLVLNTLYLMATAVAFWQARTPQLPARWPMILFMCVHAAVMFIGAGTVVTGAFTHAPPLLSMFGIIHFESILFSIGSAMCLVALVKGRNEAAARYDAGIDSLTGIANRASFIASAEQALAQCRKDGVPASVVMFDLDRFKAVNDTHGHAIGDAVIRKFCGVVNMALRPNDIFGRLGGEEFALVLPRSGVEPAMIRADRIRAAFAEEGRVVKEIAVKATVSCGIAVSVIGDATLSALLEQADEALYRAKSEGRNRVRRGGQAALDEEPTAPVIRVA